MDDFSLSTMVDPYESIRSLDFQWTEPGVMRRDLGGDSGSYTEEPTEGYWSIPWQQVEGSPFDSKYTAQTATRDLGDGRLAVRMGVPGAHKYDTWDAIYQKGVDGRYTLTNTPTDNPTRETSSWKQGTDQIRDGIEKAAAMAAVGGGMYLGASALSGLGGALGGAGAGAGGAAAAAVDPIAAYLATGAVEGSTIGSALTGAGGAAGAVGSGSLASMLGGGALAGAGKGALANGGLTALQGGDLRDILKSAAIGGISGGAGSLAQGYTGSQALAGAARGLTGSALSGGNLRDVLRAGASGFAGGYSPDVAQSIGIDNPYARDAINSGVRGAGLAAINGGNIGTGALANALPGAVSGIADLFMGDEMPDVGTLGGTMQDEYGESSATLGGEQTPIQADAVFQSGLPGDVKTKQSFGSSFSSPALGNFFSSLVPQTPQAFGSLAEGLLGMYAGHRQRRDAKKMMNAYNSNRGAYAQNLQRTLQRKDAASGRRSDYGGREVELQAKLAELDSRNAPGLAQLSNMRNSGLAQMLAAGLRTGGKLGVFGDNFGAPQAQPQPYQAPYLASLAEPPQINNMNLLQPNLKNKLGNGGS